MVVDRKGKSPPGEDDGGVILRCPRNVYQNRSCVGCPHRRREPVRRTHLKEGRLLTRPAPYHGPALSFFGRPAHILEDGYGGIRVPEMIYVRVRDS